MRTTFVLSMCWILIAGIQARAQEPAAPTTNAMLKFGFDEVSGWLATAADLVPAEKYTYKPVGTVRSFGELMAHAADGMNWYCGSARVAKDVQWSDAVEKAGTTKAKVVAALKTATAACATAYGSPTSRIHRLMGNISHANLHYGNAIVYLRMLGLKPPSS
jgi:hypothetical protein